MIGQQQQQHIGEIEDEDGIDARRDADAPIIEDDPFAGPDDEIPAPERVSEPAAEPPVAPARRRRRRRFVPPAFGSRREILDAAAEAAAQAALNVLRRHRRQFDLGGDDDMARVSGQIGEGSRAVLRAEIEGSDDDDDSLCSLPQEEVEDDDDDETPPARPAKRVRARLCGFGALSDDEDELASSPAAV